MSEKIFLFITGMIMFIIGIVVLLIARKKYISAHQKSIEFPLPKHINNKGNIFFFIGIFLIVLSSLLK